MPRRLIVLLLLNIAATAVAADAPPFKIAAQCDDDHVEVQAEKDAITFSIRSPSGIGSAVIQRRDDTWPASVVLRLHLQGLESFQISNGKLRLGAALSSQDGTVRLWQDDREDAPLNSKSPLWMEIRPIGADGRPSKTIPLKDGYFEMRLPKAFCEGQPESITVKWIDFYR